MLEIPEDIKDNIDQATEPRHVVRRLYFEGSHTGLIFYMTDTASNVSDVDKLREAMRKSKGPDNFRNLFVNGPGARKVACRPCGFPRSRPRTNFSTSRTVRATMCLHAHRVPAQ
ncbi:hypothetical protein [Herbaspirillum sp. GW103]|uniref:hypothetical protein n=1 Tax=Herbaspirillum sp. GW103 TaxID=1175306 RepID=UPI001ED97E75|nr:hypothetical protein [Herbaspirillum sp. GW103]